MSHISYLAKKLEAIKGFYWEGFFFFFFQFFSLFFFFFFFNNFGCPSQLAYTSTNLMGSMHTRLEVSLHGSV